MIEKKNQHFVPKLYLKQFSINSDNNQVGLFYLGKELFKKAVPLKSQAKEDFFYGEDGTLEEALSKLEGEAAPFFKNIIATNSLPQKNEAGYLSFFTFCIVMANRTKDAVEQVKELSDKMIREIMSYDEKFKDKIADLRIYPKNPAAMAVEATLSRLPLAFDLKVKLLINKTTTKFITSDHPVIRYNQFLEQRKHPGGNVGIATKGLEIFFPISANHMLCFYDEQVYKIGFKSKDIIELINPTDIDKLNYLQILNCFDHLYFNHEVSEWYIRQLYNKAKSKRMSEYSTLNKINSFTDKEGLEHIQYHSYGHNLEVNLELSFITQTKKAKKYVLSDFAVQLRNENIRGKLR
jgi:hypothetical protein